MEITDNLLVQAPKIYTQGATFRPLADPVASPVKSPSIRASRVRRATLSPDEPPYFKRSDKERQIVRTPYAAKLHSPSSPIDGHRRADTGANDMPTDFFEVETLKLLTDSAEFFPPPSWHSEATNQFSFVRDYGNTVALTVPFDSEAMAWSLVIGRGIQADVRFTAQAISRRHMRIEAQDGFFYVTRLSQSSLWVDGRKLNKGHRVLIVPGQHISLGQLDNYFEFRVEQNLELRPKIVAPRAKKIGEQPKLEVPLHRRSIDDFFPVFRDNDFVREGPLSGHDVSIPRQLDEAEVYIGKEKRPYIGKMQVWIHLTGKKVIRLKEEHTGRVYVFGMDEIISIRDKNHDVTALTNVKNPQYRDKDYNQSGLDGSKMQVFVDLQDPRLSRGFIDKYILPISRELALGLIDKTRAAQLARNAVSKHVEYDKPRTYTKFENRRYNLGEFIKKAVCNERAMILQVALQYLGIQSTMEKGFMPNGGRHAWVRTDDPDIRYQMVLDPQQKSAFNKWDARFDVYVDDHTPFVIGHEDDANGAGRHQMSGRPEAHLSWHQDQPF